MEYTVAIPTRGRAGKVTTISILPDNIRVCLFVNTEQEKAEYSQHDYKRPVDIIVSNKQGITKNRNFMLDYFGNDKHIVTMCDDVDGVFRLSYGKLAILSPEQLDSFIKKGFELCIKNNTKLWGCYPVPNAFYMSEKITGNGFIIGTFSGIIVSDIRHDENLILKEDYDFTIKHILKYKKAVRFNNYCVKAKHYSNKGGCVDYRNDEAEQSSIRILKENYPLYVRDNPRRKNEILLNFKVFK